MNIIEKKLKNYIKECNESIESNIDSEDAETVAGRQMLAAVVSDLEFLLKNVQDKEKEQDAPRKRKFFFDSFGDGKLYEYFPETNSISREETESPEYFL